MKTWPDTDGDAVTHYLRQLRLRSQGAEASYRRILRGFQEIAASRQCSSSKVSRETLEAWLRDRVLRMPVSTVLHRSRIVCRFLDFLVREGLTDSNPVAELGAQYCVKCSQPIIRALLEPDPDQALESLRQLPPFGSVLGDLMRRHVELMRSRGYRYETQARILLRFDRFLQEHPELAETPIEHMLHCWAAARSTVFHAAECEGLSRILGKARQHLDSSIQLPRRDGHPERQVRQQCRQPYIYTPEEVRLLLDVARAYPSPRSPLRPLSLYTMLVLGYCAGLRLGEIARLDLGDVDLQIGAITIRETKFFKSRILPLSGSVVAALEEYLQARRRAGAPQDPAAGLFWHEQGPPGRYVSRSIAASFVDILRRAGLKPLHGKTGPRIHDLRHAMVVNRMLAWYRAGINPQSRLPYLATYLGHQDIHSTLVYLTVTQDLLQQAGERFRTYGAHCLRATEGVQP